MMTIDENAQRRIIERTDAGNGMIFEHNAWLRCRFDFAHNKPTWFSMWNDSGPNDCDKAAFQNKNGLIRASIEAKNVITREIITVVECNGIDFCNFQWLAIASTPAMAKFARVTSKNVGLALVTRDKKINVFVNGKITVENRSEAEKNFHYASYGR